MLWKTVSAICVIKNKSRVVIQWKQLQRELLIEFLSHGYCLNFGIKISRLLKSYLAQVEPKVGCTFGDILMCHYSKDSYG